jgi:membrane protein
MPVYPSDPTGPSVDNQGELESSGADERIGIRRRLIEGVRQHDVSGLSAEIAYRFLFAVFPFGLFVAALGAFVAGLVHVDNPAQLVLNGLGDNLPPDIAASLRPELEHLLNAGQPGVLGLGALLALWAATGGTNALVKGIHRAYGVPEQRPFLLRYAVAVGLTILAAVGVIASFVTIVGGAFFTQQLADRLGLGSQALLFLQIVRWPAVFIGLVAAVAILYRYAPSIVVPWRWILVGATVFAAGWLIATAALGFYAANVANYGATYGSLGAVIVLMLWFYLTALVLLLGCEVTAALARERSPGEIHRRGEEEAATARVDGAADEVGQRVKGAASGVVSRDRA